MHFTLTQHTQDFLQYCRQKGHSPGTMAAYTQAVRKFLDYADAAGVTEAEAVTRLFLRAYAQQVSEALSPGGAHARLRPLKTFFNWLEAEEVIAKSPMTRVPMPKMPRQVLPAIDPEQVGQLMTAALHSRLGVRDRAIIAVLFDTGVRVSELCGIHLEDVQAGGRIYVRQAKGGRGRVVPISRSALRHLTKYLNSGRPRTRLTQVFLSDAETPMNRDSVKQMLERLCRVAKLPNFTPHTFRRGFAVNYLRNSGDVFTLQRIMGHATLEMTNRYAVLHDDDLKDVHRRASPMSGVGR
ncbi:tyrosine-type recombinase/integrase [Deinococcus soli (ex Cha et al. 2016)]|uniref:tyrosine-type recombinase/integrase n=1 Tax=Deinococcus soli (ex Cha et al. 2016) TaxID=1309411 RepID=UPI0016687DAE|nr:tyrosine-type recombinase/integrase [Deinococcus soli (ex Cha et al. 2016)]GGB54907.1 tyrosine recombinase XerD [Deinococcus soli (ex Cha et al. 2016)]